MNSLLSSSCTQAEVHLVLLMHHPYLSVRPDMCRHPSMHPCHTIALFCVPEDNSTPPTCVLA
jgi:hypothetical protein